MPRTLIRHHARLVALAFVTMMLAGASTGLKADAEPPLARLLVIGETHGTAPITHQIVQQAVDAGATGCVCLGDFIYGDANATPEKWRQMMAPVMDPFLPAQGNHDWPWGDWSTLFPKGRAYFTMDVEGVQFIAINPEHDRLAPGTAQFDWLVGALESRPADEVKIVILHRPWWLANGAVHPAEQFDNQAGLPGATLEKMLRDAGVDLVIAGHERSYQHSQRGGMEFLVAGVGGATFYPLDYPLEGEVIRLVHNVVTLLDVRKDEVRLTTTDLDGRVVETFALPRPPTGEAPVIDPRPGNEWWVQASVRGENVTSVAARVGEGYWVPLLKRGTGMWAMSLLAPEGSVVMFRATDREGRVTETPPYTWPDAAPSAYAKPDLPARPDISTEHFTATFAPEGGAWWVSTRVEPPGAYRVEARVDDGEWVQLESRDWGQWAAGLYAPPGVRVTFRAMSSEGIAMSEPFSWDDRVSRAI